ncbi:MAG: transcriptional regulator [SAR92 bacterium BACL26 MAG-121220-bin70]|jgi:MerR family transcriptional regulator, redox-sensitive transcriptional activator SoxR|uniref:Redox-sensitive transcriptional activator SoxR n=1 Tax=SAR92 bacterium BACL26 MAG-121220-bin70 TaxID=1655626 RepID=A0A0R2U3D0_9GAMM|nr:MAG: transcriptional regulator [SAR92 bacterium BACL26 MAG-121220-bin70]
MLNKKLGVGFVAKRCGVNVSTLHFYEQKGLIYSNRNQGNQRRYKPDVIRRVAIIKAAQKLGIGLTDIKRAFSVLPDKATPNKQQWAAMSASWQQTLNDKISYMQRLRDSLDRCIGCGCLSMQSCPIYNPEDILASKGPGPVILDASP